MDAAYDIFTLTAQANGAVATERFVAPDGSQAGAGVNTLGVAITEAADGEDFPVRHLGSAIVEAGAALNADGSAPGLGLEGDDDGRAVPHAAGVLVARLAPGASASGAGRRVEVIPIPN